MKLFKETLNGLLGNIANIPADTSTIKTPDSNVGSFGEIEGASKDVQDNDKLVIYAGNGIEIHIPTDIFNKMSDAMNNSAKFEGDVNDGECDNSNAKDCPFNTSETEGGE